MVEDGLDSFRIFLLFSWTHLPLSHQGSAASHYLSADSLNRSIRPRAVSRFEVVTHVRLFGKAINQGVLEVVPVIGNKPLKGSEYSHPSTKCLSSRFGIRGIRGPQPHIARKAISNDECVLLILVSHVQEVRVNDLFWLGSVKYMSQRTRDHVSGAREETK